MDRLSKLEIEDLQKDSALSEVEAEQKSSSLEEVVRQNSKTIELVSKLVHLMVENPSYGGTAENRPDEVIGCLQRIPYDLFKNINLADGEYEQFEQMLELRMEVANVNSERAKLDILLSRLTRKQQEAWQAMDKDDRRDYQSVKRHLKRLFGSRGTMTKREFWFLRQQKAETALQFAQRVWNKHGFIKGIEKEDAFEVIKSGCTSRVGDKLHYKYSDFETIIEDINCIEHDLKLRKEIWNYNFSNSCNDRSNQLDCNRSSFAKKKEGFAHRNVADAVEGLKKMAKQKYGLSEELAEKRIQLHQCLQCGNTGHSARKCPSNFKSRDVLCSGQNKKEDKDGINRDQNEQMREAIERVNVDELFDDDTSLLIKGSINGYSSFVKVDTGAQISLVDSSVVKPADIRPTRWNPVGANGGKIAVLGETSIQFKAFGKCIKLLALVCPKIIGKHMLLGYSDFKKLGGKMHVDEVINSNSYRTDYNEERSFIENSIARYYSNRPNELSTLRPVEINLKSKSKVEDISSKPFRSPKLHKDLLNKKLETLVNEGILRESEGVTASPVFLLKKPKNNEYRLLCDFRKLNTHTEGVATTLNNMEDLLNFAKGKSIFTLIDLQDGFFQVAIDEKSKPLTGIVTQERRYEFNVLPQGAKQAPACFHNRIKEAIRGLENVYNYIDDIIIMSQNITEAKEDFIALLKVLTKLNLRVNWSKAQIFMKEVEFLGVILSEKGKRAGSRAHKLSTLRKPKSKNDLRKLLAKIGAFQNFVKGYSIKIAPVLSMLKKKSKFKWEDNHTRILRHVIDEILSRTLFFPQDEETLEIHCDAAKFGIGATLQTKAGKIVKCFNETLTDSQSRWSTFEKELYAIRQALKAFEKVALNKNLEVFSDNQAVVKFIKGGGEVGGKPLRIREWLSDLLDRQFEVKWIKGAENVNADTLSRLAVAAVPDSAPKHLENTPSPTDSNELEILELKRNRDSKNTARKRIKRLLRENNDGNESIGTCQGKDLQVVVAIPKKPTQNQNYAPKNQSATVIKKAHQSHAGIQGMQLNLRDVAFPQKNEQIKSYISNCIECRSKQAPRRCRMKGLRAEKFGEKVALDSFYCKSGKIGFVAVDLMTSFSSIATCERKLPANSLSCLLGLMSSIGLPKVVLTDNGTEFEGVFRAYCEKWGIEVLKTVAFHPSSNPAERKIQEIKKLISIYGDEQIKRIEMLLNHQRSSVSGFSPAELVTGTECLGVLHNNERKYMEKDTRIEVDKKITMNRDRKLWKANKHLRNIDFSIGDEVIVFVERGVIKHGKVLQKEFHNAYLVDIEGEARKVHSDYILKKPLG